MLLEIFIKHIKFKFNILMLRKIENYRLYYHFVINIKFYYLSMTKR